MKAASYAALFDSLQSPHMVLDRDLTFVACNQAYEAAVGFPRQALIGNRLFDMFPNDGESGRRLRASIQTVFADGESDTIAFIPYDIPRRDDLGGGFERRYWTATHTPLTGDDGQVEFVVQNTIDVTDMMRLKESFSLPFATIPGELALLRHAQEVEEAYQETASESAEFRRLFRQAPGMIAVLEGPDQIFSFVNDSFSRFVGGREMLGLPVREAMPEMAGQGYLEMMEAVYRDGRSFQGAGVRLLVRSEPDAEPTEVYIDFSYDPIRDADGQVTGVFLQSADRTEFVRAVQRQRHLIDELNHRVKNTLSTVQSMARQSFRNLLNAEDARYAFEARIMALSQAHNILSARGWEAAGLSVLLEQELAGFDRDRVSFGGQEVHLTAKSAIALAMVFHELSSNAQNYGPLASDAGRLSIAWSVVQRSGSRCLSLEWIETTTVILDGELTQGFGTRMLRRIIEGELAGLLSLELQPTGLVCRIEIPLSEVQALQSNAA